MNKQRLVRGHYYEEALTLEEVIRMTKTFRDYDRENDKITFTEEGRKEGKLTLLSSMIEKGILSLKQAADEMNMTIPQFESEIKNLSID